MLNRVIGRAIRSTDIMKYVDNNAVYKEILSALLEPRNRLEKNGVYSELMNWVIELNPYDYTNKIGDMSEEYAQHELEWYLSMDLNINGHAGIESNPVWKRCATEDGHVNSNYGWCLFSEENSKQFARAAETLKEDKYSRQAVMMYSRPSINVEHNDGKHANHDMICTIYTDALIRPVNKTDVLFYNVHMRSNDIRYGFRYDFCWHITVYNKLLKELSQTYPDLGVGKIFWNADSLHLYERDVEFAKQILNKPR